MAFKKTDRSSMRSVPIYVNQQVILNIVFRWMIGGRCDAYATAGLTTYIYRNEVGSYRRTFEVPDNWSGREVYLNFDGVDSFSIYGLMENMWDSPKFPKPCCIQHYPFLHPKGKNTVAVEVYRSSDASFEAQDMFRLPGIPKRISDSKA